MKPPRIAEEYRTAILQYGARSYTKTLFQGFIYRFLVELLNCCETDLRTKFPDLDDHTLTHLTIFQSEAQPAHQDFQFLIEQDISITIESDGDGWTAILWSDVGSRDLSQSQDFRWFFEHLKACSKTGHRWIYASPGAFLGIDSQRKHPLPTPAQGSVKPSPANDGALTQAAAHLPNEFHLMIDHNIAALDPLYALTPIFQFAAMTSNNAVLSDILRRYRIISSTLWDPDHSREYMEQLILYKHILDDNATRHEQVLSFLRSPNLAEYAKRLSPDQHKIADAAKRDVEADYECLLRYCREYSQHHQSAISILTSAVTLRESSKQITLATQVTKLTILATIFLPLSFCTSIFAVGVVTLLVYYWDERRQFKSFVKRVWIGKGQDEFMA
ncbi:hypothetical protein GQ44DRAFT_739295 [Phaeosphaeriaceae sp. PMI808]|nr:hypothetical protein GQ44DRAFT_739295 [Phaeosphaeriaceae sp. PMI808]